MASIDLDWVVGLFWFMLKTYVFVFIFVWMRGTLPRVRIDQLMGFAWKWLVPAALLNIFVTAGAILVLKASTRASCPARRSGRELIPGLGIAKGMALTLRRFFQPKVTIQYPEVAQRDLAAATAAACILLYDECGHAQVRDLLPVRPACPIECIDMGGVDTRDRYHVHWGAARAVRRAARGVGPAPLRPAGAGPRVHRRSPPIDLAPLDRILAEHDYDPQAPAAHPRGDPGRVRPPAGRRAPAHQPPDRRLVQRDLRHRQLLPHLRFEPAAAHVVAGLPARRSDAPAAAGH